MNVVRLLTTKGPFGLQVMLGIALDSFDSILRISYYGF